MRKSDVLFLIVGTNPMPNIISIENRIKDNGKIFFICSKENNTIFSTDKIVNDIKKIMDNKYPNIVTNSIPVNIQDESNMIQEIINMFPIEKNITVELNYTGGTKLMSSAIYGYFKKIMRSKDVDIILSYLDCEKDLFVFEENEKGKIRFLEEKLEINNIYNKFTLKDIILSHGLNYNKDRKETNFEDISYEMFSNFELKSIEEKNQWVEELNSILQDKENIKELLLKFIDKQVVNSDLTSINTLEVEKLKKYSVGDNLEEYIFRILTMLREEKEVDEFIWSYQQNKTKKMAGTEIDFIIIRGTKNYLLSVTLCEDEYICKPKLYEAKTRAQQISGDETRVGFICLYNSYKELEELIEADDKYSKDLVIAIDNFNDMKNKLRQWLRR